MTNPSTPPVVHGSFTLQRTFGAPVARVFATWSDVETKARWFIGPPDTWTLRERSLDFRVGGSEVLVGEHASGSVTRFVARYHVIVPDERLVYAYDMYVGTRHLSVSLATVELTAAAGGGTRMAFTEQAAFLDGEDGTRSRERGTDAHFDRLAPVLGDRRELVSARVLDAPRDVVFEAFSDPRQLARWWGPKGFTSTFHEFDLRPGGAWRLVMRGPNGTDYPMVKDFIGVARPERIVLRHQSPVHGFTQTMTFGDLGGRTHVTWRMRFESEEEAERVRGAITEANEQNFDRLAAHLASVADR
jgi:uncharacterized protein YndB with AHSA1/START domain